MGLNPEQIQPKPRVLGKVSTDPAPAADRATIYSKEVSGITELFVMDSAGNAVQMTTNGSVNLPAIPSLVPAGGAQDSVLVKGSNSDYVTTWKKVYQLQKEFFFVLPAGADIAARILLAGTITGLELTTASGDSTPEVEFGSSAKTLVVKPVGGSGIIIADFDVMKLVETGTDIEKGWSEVSTLGPVKSNTARTKAAFLNFQDYIDSSQDVLVRVRFVNPTDMQSLA